MTRHTADRCLSKNIQRCHRPALRLEKNRGCTIKNGTREGDRAPKETVLDNKKAYAIRRAGWIRPACGARTLSAATLFSCSRHGFCHLLILFVQSHPALNSHGITTTSHDNLLPTGRCPNYGNIVNVLFTISTRLEALHTDNVGLMSTLESFDLRLYFRIFLRKASHVA